jgi:sec-independent protein translocase protein TatB
MFDIGSPELLLVAVIAIIVIGPKDLPKAMRILGYWVGRARSVMGQFRSGFDAMVREAELAELEKRWAAENERIMREHPQEPGKSLLPPGGSVIENDTAPVAGSVDTVVTTTGDAPIVVDAPAADRAEPAPVPDAATPQPFEPELPLAEQAAHSKRSA